MKTKIDIINETVEYYSVDPVARRSRASDGTCKYFGEDGKMCAFARYAHPGWLDELKLLEGWSADTCLCVKGIPLNDEVKHFSNDGEFWVAVQKLHDIDTYWDSTGLTESGVTEMQRLKQKYEN